MQFDLTYSDLYDMTPYELNKTLEQRKQGLAYKLWKQGNLGQFMKKYPNSPEEACPELQKPKKKYKMEDWMKEKYLIKRGGK